MLISLEAPITAPAPTGCPLATLGVSVILAAAPEAAPSVVACRAACNGPFWQSGVPALCERKGRRTFGDRRRQSAGAARGAHCCYPGFQGRTAFWDACTEGLTRTFAMVGDRRAAIARSRLRNSPPQASTSLGRCLRRCNANTPPKRERGERQSMRAAIKRRHQTPLAAAIHVHQQVSSRDWSRFERAQGVRSSSVARREARRGSTIGNGGGDKLEA